MVVASDRMMAYFSEKNPNDDDDDGDGGAEGGGDRREWSVPFLCSEIRCESLLDGEAKSSN